MPTRVNVAEIVFGQLDVEVRVQSTFLCQVSLVFFIALSQSSVEQLALDKGIGTCRQPSSASNNRSSQQTVINRCRAITPWVNIRVQHRVSIFWELDDNPFLSYLAHFKLAVSKASIFAVIFERPVLG